MEIEKGLDTAGGSGLYMVETTQDFAFAGLEDGPRMGGSSFLKTNQRMVAVALL